MKDIAKYLPGIGWTFLFMEYPFLTRNWIKDEKRLKEACENLTDYPVNMLVSTNLSNRAKLVYYAYACINNVYLILHV